MSLKIAVDGMGGDRAPGIVVEGVNLALKHAGVQFVIFGDSDMLQSFFPSPHPSVTIIHAPQKIDAGNTGILTVLRRHKSSLALAMKALAAGEVDAVVSAGDSRAVVAMAKHYVGLIGKVKRPVLGVFVPVTPDHDVLLVDAGAYTGLHAVPLVQAALVGEIYWSMEKGSTNPRIALLNIGHEKFKGPVEVRRAAKILQGLPVNFAGFVEPQDLFVSPSSVDVLVTNGFTGNLFLKLYESLSEYLLSKFEFFFHRACQADPQNFHVWQEQFSRYRYERTGGAPLLGVKKPVVVAHGRSESVAVCKAIEKAIALVRNNFAERMEAGIESNAALKNVSILYKSWAVSTFGGSKKES
jgi:glycerol-3-phosphate acyltransferase PlsX